MKLISFDGDQTLYSDGGNFEDNDELALAIILLLKHGVKVALITAAGYGYDYFYFFLGHLSHRVVQVRWI